MRISAVFIAAALICSCGKMKMGSNAGGASTVSDGGSTATLSLWSRGPVQAAGSPVDSQDNLNTLPRQNVNLYNLSDPKGNLTGANVYVRYRTTDQSSPVIAGFEPPNVVPWNNRAFKAYMVYAHASNSLKYMKSLYPAVSFQAFGQNLLPLPGYSEEQGSPLNTRYAVNLNNHPGTIMFYQDPDFPNIPYNPADESDAILHETGHLLQHALNPDVLETPGNYDMDALLEGLADFYAASVTGSDQILLFLGTNAPLVFSANNRNGINHNRALVSKIYYPYSYTGEIHLDGRVLSSALNDIRKFLKNEQVDLSQMQCTSNCVISWGAPVPFGQFQAFDRVTKLAYDSLREMIPTSTFIHYAQRFLSKVSTADWSAQCNGNSTCAANLVNGVGRILLARGLATTRPIRSTGFSYSGNSPDLSIPAGLNLIPLGGGLSNTDAKIDRCEGFLMIPNFSLQTTVNASVYDNLFELESSSGMISLNNIDSTTVHQPIYDTGQIEIKLFGFLLPGESLRTLAGVGSRYYLDHFGSHLAPSVLNSSNPSPLGWAFKAPSGPAGTQGSITYRISFRPYEVLYQPSSVYKDLRIQQAIQISAAPANFCGF